MHRCSAEEVVVICIADDATSNDIGGHADHARNDTIESISAHSVLVAHDVLMTSISDFDMNPSETMLVVSTE